MEKQNWTEEQVKEELLRIKDELGLATLPSVKQIKGINRSCLFAVQRMGGLTKFSAMLDIPLYARQLPSEYAKRDGKGADESFIDRKYKPRISRCSEIEAEARKQGLRYADIQKAKLLEMAGRIQV